ncbi:hypothetical protein [Alteromonas facilis]|uniref:hypothetical protein n=1 Tax=Alteromonas facilis TaxID=2048004 RepID=UPI000F5D4475|nr:hypothetical protein [Alteromonas facilis]
MVELHCVQTPNAKRQTPNAKRQTPNAKRQTPNAKRQTPNAKRQTPNAKRQTLDVVPPVICKYSHDFVMYDVKRGGHLFY